MDNQNFEALRAHAAMAYDLLADQSEPETAKCLGIGHLFYPQNLPGDQRRLGGIIALSIKVLDDHFKRKVLFGGPAFAVETRRLLVADVVASAHMHAKDMGYLHKIIRAWYPDDEAPVISSEKVTPDRPSPRPFLANTEFSDREDLENALHDLSLAFEGVINLFNVHGEGSAACSLQRTFWAFRDRLVAVLKAAHEGEG